MFNKLFTNPRTKRYCEGWIYLFFAIMTNIDCPMSCSVIKALPHQRFIEQLVKQKNPKYRAMSWSIEIFGKDGIMRKLQLPPCHGQLKTIVCMD